MPTRLLTSAASSVAACSPRAPHCSVPPGPCAGEHLTSAKPRKSSRRQTHTHDVSVRKVPPSPSSVASYAFVVPSTKLIPVSYTHLRAHETVLDLVCRLLLE